MTVSLKSLKMLWGRSAGMCSMPNCSDKLYVDATETDDEALIGEQCHIVAESEDGPRGKRPLPQNQRNKYDNLILLCRNHHKEIDSQVETFTVDKLHDIKNMHENWVRNNLPDFDLNKQRDDEYYASLVDEWARRIRLDDWLAWSSHILSFGQPSMAVELNDDLSELRRWLLGRIWPGRYPDLEAAFQNLFLVLSDFHNIFSEHAEEMHKGSDTLITRRFYKIPQWDPDLYHKLLREYEYHVDLVGDLMCELTRAANLICDEVRASILQSFRLEEGRLMVQSGPDMAFRFSEFVVQYSVEERQRSSIYSGLDKFETARHGRDFCFGEETEFDEKR